MVLQQLVINFAIPPRYFLKAAQLLYIADTIAGCAKHLEVLEQEVLRLHNRARHAFDTGDEEGALISFALLSEPWMRRVVLFQFFIVLQFSPA